MNIIFYQELTRFLISYKDKALILGEWVNHFFYLVGYFNHIGFGSQQILRCFFTCLLIPIFSTENFFNYRKYFILYMIYLDW